MQSLTSLLRAIWVWALGSTPIWRTEARVWTTKKKTEELRSCSTRQLPMFPFEDMQPSQRLSKCTIKIPWCQWIFLKSSSMSKRDVALSLALLFKPRQPPYWIRLPLCFLDKTIWKSRPIESVCYSSSIIESQYFALPVSKVILKWRLSKTSEVEANNVQESSATISFKTVETLSRKLHFSSKSMPLSQK